MLTALSINEGDFNSTLFTLYLIESCNIVQWQQRELAEKNLFLKSWTSCQCGVRGLLTASCFSDSGVPEHRGWLPGSSAGWGWIWWWLLPLPAGQDGHAVLFTEVLLRTLASFDLPTQNSIMVVSPQSHGIWRWSKVHQHICTCHSMITCRVSVWKPHWRLSSWIWEAFISE